MTRLVEPDESLRDLVARVIDNAKAYLKAEVALVKQTASTKVEQFRPAAIFLIVALLLVQAALTVLVIALGMTLAIWLGPPGGIAAGGTIALLLAGLLVWLAVRRITGSAS